MSQHTQQLAPPAAPWVPLQKQKNSGGYLSVYLSSPLARLPVRDVTRLGDNKSDPNLETLSYGLFSTCEPIMRKSIATRGITDVFFLTTLEGRGRALVGRYELGWLVEVEKTDIALAASAARFIDPIPVSRISGRAGRAVQKQIRNFMIVDEGVTADLRALIDGVRDRTQDYLQEIDRLERMSLARTGFRYPTWDRVEPFDWPSAAPYLSDLSEADARANTSETGAWICSHCGSRIENRARLKVCNVCRRRGTLEPEVAS